MAEEKKQTYEELAAERDACKVELDAIKRDRVNRQRAAAETMDLCIEKGCLAKYLNEHRAEVEKVMMTMVSPEYIKMAAERTARIKEAIGAYRFAEMPEAKIKDLIIRRYDLTPTYAQNFLDDDTDEDDCRPEAI